MAVWHLCISLYKTHPFNCLKCYSAICKNSNCLYIFCTIDPIDNVSVNSVLWVFWNNVSFHDKQSKEEPLYTYSLFNIMTIICLERKTFIFSGVSMWQSRFDYTFLCFIEKKLPQKRLAISNDVTKICQIISSITIKLDTYVRLTHNKNKLTKHLQVPLFIALKS